MRVGIRVLNPEPGMPGKGDIEASKNQFVRDAKAAISELLEVPAGRLRILGAGKELSDDNKIFEYKFTDDVVWQIVIRPDLSKMSDATGSGGSPQKKKPRLDEEADKENKNESAPKAATSEYFEVGDLVDAVDPSFDYAWFPAVVVEIYEWNPEYHDDGGDAETDGLEYWVKYHGQHAEEEPGRVRLGQLRPRALTKIPKTQLESGRRVLVNYNCEKGSGLGYWYDAVVVEPPQGRRNKMTAIVQRSNGTEVDNCLVSTDPGVFEIRQRSKRSERDPDEKFQDEGFYPKRPCRPRCDACGDDARAKCRECGCSACGGKDDISLIVLCDECGDGYHTRCADPPLGAIPDDDWYCARCKTDRSQVVGAGEKLKKSAKLAKSKAATSTSTRDWGKGMATAGQAAVKVLGWVPRGFSGKIRGIEVGMTWQFRAQVSGYGVHCPLVGGIHGRETGGTPVCFSIVLAGGYEDDVDSGDVVVFTGSGGRNLKDGNKRCSAQDSDQVLTRGNLALAYTCTGKANPDKERGVAKDWRKTLPIRVCRSAKGKVHSKYAPAEGIRYDGIYKIQEYWREKGESGFYVYRFQLKRDDDTPAPWTPEGAARIKQFAFDTVLKAKQPASEVWKQRFTPNAKERKLIEDDVVNKAHWDDCLAKLPCVELDFLDDVSKTFRCNICHSIPVDPVNAPCGHLFCLKCIGKLLKDFAKCPTCCVDFEKEYRPTVNKSLKGALHVFLPGYEQGGR